MHPLRLAGSCLAFFCWLCATTRASADPAQAAAEHFERATVFLKAKRYEDAIRELTEAHRISPHPRVLYNLAQAELALGRHADAYEAFSAYLEQSEAELSSSERRAVRRILDELEPRIARLRLSVEPTASNLVVDGERRDFKTHLALEPGRHSVALEAAGYEAESTELELPAGEQTVLRVRLLRAESALARGWLSIECKTPAVRVRVDDSVLGPAPASPLELIEGEHQIRFERLGAPVEVAQVMVAAGQTRVVACHLPRVRVLAEHAAPKASRARFYWALGLGAAGAATSVSALTLGLYNHGRYSNWERIQGELNQRWQDPSDVSVVSAQGENDAYARSIHRLDGVTVGLGTAGGLLLLGAAGVAIFGQEQEGSRVAVGSNGMTWSGQW